MASRTITRASALLRTNLRQQTAPFSTTPRALADRDLGGDKTHMTDKKGGHKDIQSEASKGAHDERTSGSENSGATSQKDSNDSNKKAKKEIPEAPEPVIGMNSERGGSN